MKKSFPPLPRWRPGQFPRDHLLTIGWCTRYSRTNKFSETTFSPSFLCSISLFSRPLQISMIKAFSLSPRFLHLTQQSSLMKKWSDSSFPTSPVRPFSFRLFFKHSRLWVDIFSPLPLMAEHAVPFSISPPDSFSPLMRSRVFLFCLTSRVPTYHSTPNPPPCDAAACGNLVLFCPPFSG